MRTPALHWSTGIAAGALYVALRTRLDLGIGSRLLFGAALFGVLDEGAMAALKLAPPARKFPWQTHARGVAGHLVLAAIEAAFDFADLA